MKTLLILNDPAYGTERSYNGLRLAGALAKRDDSDVRVFLIGDGHLLTLTRVAANIVAELTGRTPDATFAGSGACFVELGDGKAASPPVTSTLPTAPRSGCAAPGGTGTSPRSRSRSTGCADGPKHRARGLRSR